MWCRQCHNDYCSYRHTISLSQLHYTSTCRKNSGSIPACEPCTDLMDLENEIRGTVKHLQNLLGKHQGMKMRMNQQHSRIIHHMPPEIMGNIFNFCMPADMHDDLKKADSKDIFMPFKLGAVSKIWRRIAWSTPQLWTHLALFGRPIKNLLVSNFVQEWIERSKVLPISIYLEGMNCTGSEPDGGPPAEYRPLLRAFSACSGRWSNINIELRDNFLFYLTNQVTDASNLRTIRLRTNPSAVETEVYVYFNNAVLARARKVSMWHIYPAQVNVDWKLVTHVELEDVLVEACLELLGGAPMLKSCRLLDVKGHDDLPDRPCQPVVAERLQHLYFESSRRCHIFFMSLVLTNISDLSLCLPTLDPFIHPSVLPFLQRSSFTLVRLSFLEVPADWRHLHALLKVTPYITHLHLGDFLCNKEGKQKVVIDPFIKHLSSTSRNSNSTGSASSSRLLHNLQSLELSLGYLFKWSDHALGIFHPFFDFSRPLRPLKSLTITDNPFSSTRDKSPRENYIPRNYLTRIMELKRNGATIVYTHHGGRDVIEISRIYYKMLNAESQSSGSE